MNVIQEKLLADGEFVNQVASLVGVIADKLPSNGKLSDEIESFVNDSVEESISDQEVDVGAIVDEKMDDYDMTDKVSDALDGLDVLNEDQVTEIASQALYDYDWYQVISDHDLLTRDELDIDDKVEEIVDAKMFSFVQSLMRKQFDADTTEWLDRLRQRAVSDHLAANAKAESTEAAKETEGTPIQV